MRSAILVSSTERLEGYEIEKYFELISTNVVLGTNFFSDIGASFTDFFGGNSEIYQSKLEKIYKVAIDKLKNKASTINANGIIGVRIDFDEISGGGKSMFMISVSGTAVKLKLLKKVDLLKENNSSFTSDELDVMSRKIATKLKVDQNQTLGSSDWEFLIENSLEDLIPNLVESYFKLVKDYPYSDQLKIYKGYLTVLLRQSTPELVENTLYGMYASNPEIISQLIVECEMFSPSLTIDLIESGKIHYAIAILEAKKSFYTADDYTKMVNILNLLTTLPDTGKIEAVKGMLGSKEKFICDKGHQSSPDLAYCTECGRNIKGVTKGEEIAINQFSMKIEALEELFKTKT
ncbi:YbjQ family protein [Belliella aquatica]|uniref:UPF0145 protein GCM10010993_36240 n=1 Tax=Belliella aquatica TaxID=1323734 RepID=A0ABQ1N5E6_9BACT|nr:YbjQ family protein [Belliella aquatica]MCH7407582.1 YbjQ family protein [Belliella aquatica]GGC54603.1 hypothetical protein GCM10010993_36240 [Belliella aquatica]